MPLGRRLQVKMIKRPDMQPEEIERRMRRPFAPARVAAAFLGVSVNNFKKYFGTMISPADIPGRSEARPLYKTDDIRKLPTMIPVRKEVEAPKKQKLTRSFDIERMMNYAYKELENEHAA